MADMILIRSMKKEEIIGQLRGFLGSFGSLDRAEFEENNKLISQFIAEWEEVG